MKLASTKFELCGMEEPRRKRLESVFRGAHAQQRRESVNRGVAWAASDRGGI